MGIAIFQMAALLDEAAIGDRRMAIFEANDPLVVHHADFGRSGCPIMTVLGTVWALPQRMVEMGAIAHHCGTLLYAEAIITATPIGTQAIAQRWVPSYEAALIYTLEPVFATVFAFLMLGEALGTRG